MAKSKEMGINGDRTEFTREVTYNGQVVELSKLRIIPRQATEDGIATNADDFLRALSEAEDTLDRDGVRTRPNIPFDLQELEK